MPTGKYKIMPEEYEPHKLLASTEAQPNGLSEVRIREIIREELAAWEKSLPLRVRASMGWPAHTEVK